MTHLSTFHVCRVLVRPGPSQYVCWIHVERTCLNGLPLTEVACMGLAIHIGFDADGFYA